MFILSPRCALLHPENALPARSALQRNQCQPNIVFRDFENQRLLMTIVVLKADSQKVLALFREHEERRDDHRFQVPPVYFLAVLDQIDALVRNLDAGLLRDKNEIDLVGDLDVSGTFGRNIGTGASDILRSAPL